MIEGYQETDLIFGLVGATGVELKRVRDHIIKRMAVYNYEVSVVKVTEDVLPLVADVDLSNCKGEFDRTSELMTKGDEARWNAKDNAVLAIGAAAFINGARAKRQDQRKAYIISSLKHPDEVAMLRTIYPLGFYLFGVFADVEAQVEYLIKDKRMNEADARRLIRRDENEAEDHGQKLIDTFHLSDFFLRIEDNDVRLKKISGGSSMSCLEIHLRRPHLMNMQCSLHFPRRSVLQICLDKLELLLQRGVKLSLLARMIVHVPVADSIGPNSIRSLRRSRIEKRGEITP